MTLFSEERPAGAQLRFGYFLIAIMVVLLGWIAHYASQHQPSFDGAMNLQVSYSLSQGEGYRRTYAERTVFPREVQTNVPYTLPAAAVFKVFGVGKWQAQAVNIAYLAGLTLVCVLLLRKRFSLLAGLVCGLFVLITPGILDYGLHGYGEIPSLFWILFSGLIFPWKEPSARRIMLAGICLGLGVATKTVMIICFATFGLCYAISIASDPTQRPFVRVRLVVLLAVASVVPLALVEIWRFTSLGGLADYIAWWQVELNAIERQAGTEPGYADTDSSLDKLSVHLTLLSGMFGIDRWLLPFWIAIPPVFAIAWTVATGSWRRNGVLLCLTLASTLYFAWWLFVTPTQKAWHRRILDGALLLNIAWVYVLAIIAGAVQRIDKPLRARFTAVVATVFVLFCGLALANWDLRPRLIAGPVSQASFDAAVETLRELPSDAEIYGIGWYSAPAIALFSERPLLNFNDRIVMDVETDAESYLVLDWAALARYSHALVVEMYPSTPLLDAHDVKILKLDIKSPGFRGIMGAPSSGPAASRLAMDSTSPADLRGFHDVDPSGHRWMTSEGLARMTYDGSDFLELATYAPAIDRYMRKGGIALFAYLDECPVGMHQLPGNAVMVTQFRIPEDCRPGEGETVVARFAVDNLIASAMTHDERSLSLLVSSIGFASDCHHQPCMQAGNGVAGQVETTAMVAPAVDGDARANLLHATPSMLDLCLHPDGLAAIRIDWSLPPSHLGGWSIWVSAPGQGRALWTADGGPIGSEVTGRWVRDQTTFELMSHNGDRLDALTVHSLPCPR